MLGSCRDLRHLQNDNIQDAFSRLVSGNKPGYKTVLEKKTLISRCKNCRIILKGSEKFCPECGTKVEKKTGGD